MLRIVSFRRLLLLPALLLLLAPIASHAQDQPVHTETTLDVRNEPSLLSGPPAQGPALDQLNQRLYLPALYVGASVKVSFGTGYDAASRNLTGVATSFAYGIQRLYVQTSITSGAGLTVRRDFTYADGAKITGFDTVLGSNNVVSTTSYCITRGTSCSIDSDLITLDRGTYIVEIFLNNQRAGRYTIVIV